MNQTSIHSCISSILGPLILISSPSFEKKSYFLEIAEANSVDMNELRDKETDSQRVQKPEWLVMIGVCTHLGCVPVGEGE